MILKSMEFYLLFYLFSSKPIATFTWIVFPEAQVPQASGSVALSSECGYNI